MIVSQESTYSFGSLVCRQQDLWLRLIGEIRSEFVHFLSPKDLLVIGVLDEALVLNSHFLYGHGFAFGNGILALLQSNRFLLESVGELVCMFDQLEPLNHLCSLNLVLYFVGVPLDGPLLLHSSSQLSDLFVQLVQFALLLGLLLLLPGRLGGNWLSFARVLRVTGACHAL